MTRVYPKRKCLYEGCPNTWFIPRRANQLHCDGCKDAKSNAKKKKEAAELYPNEKQLKHNTKRLKALYESPQYRSGVTEFVMRHEKIDLTIITGRCKNATNDAPILWCYSYGFELVADNPYKIYKIYKR